MARNFECQQISLHQTVGEGLHYLWDPIGVAGASQARDEYAGYVDPSAARCTKASTSLRLLDIL
jgi:hypothetical protein